MFIRKTVKRYKDQTYASYLLVESVSTPQGPRQRSICSLGDLSPGPRKKWLGLANRIEAALQGQVSLEEPDPLVDEVVNRIRSAGESLVQRGDDVVAVHTDQVSLERAREAGPVHVSHGESQSDEKKLQNGSTNCGGLVTRGTARAKERACSAWKDLQGGAGREASCLARAALVILV